MLRGTALALSTQFKTVSVVGRNSAKLHELQKSNSKINPIRVDYTNSVAFIESIEESANAHGAIALVVSWIHETAPDAPLLLARRLNEHGESVDYYHVLGSAYARPDAGASQLRAAFEAFPNIEYHQVILGFILEGASSRWLSNEEISSGVNRSIESRLPFATVGTTEAWRMRP